MYVCSQTFMSVCMHVWKCMYACMYSKSTAMSLYTYLMPLNKYDCLTPNMIHTVIMLHGSIDPTFLHMCPKTQPTATSPYVIAMYGPATYILLNMPYIKIGSCEHITNCQYKYLKWTHCNQQCDQEHWYTYIPHYLNIALTNMPPPSHMYVLLHYYCGLHNDPILLDIQVLKRTKTFNYHVIAIYLQGANILQMPHAQITHCASMMEVG